MAGDRRDFVAGEAWTEGTPASLLASAVARPPDNAWVTRTEQPEQPPTSEETSAAYLEQVSWRVLMGRAPEVQRGRPIFSRLPGAPHCKLCSAPFSGPLRPIMRMMGRARWPANPKYCQSCFRQLSTYRAGAEIPCSLLFADVRDSTTLAEQMTPREFRDRMDRFFSGATKVLIEHDAMVDKYVGDEVMAVFIPGIAGEQHPLRAIEAGRALLQLTEHGLPVGVGVTSGISFVGAVGSGEKVDMTAMGDNVNIAARLASAAGAGELLVTVEAAQAADLPDDGLEHRSLALKGKSEPTQVLVVR
jgi:adenylate cyclase